MPPFSYHEAFQRNIGLLTEAEQEILRSKTIAIPGMGGVGGIHLLSLVRQGFEKFKIADPDVFELKNFNRQAGANMTTIGRKKVEVMKEMALQINPNCQIETTEARVGEQDLADYLQGVDLVIDGIDAFEVEIPRLTTIREQFTHRHHVAHLPSHVTAAYFGPSLSVPYKNGKLILGDFQRIVLVELNGPKKRQIIIQI